MSWIAVAIGGSALIGGIGSYLGGRASANASRYAAQLSADQYQQTRSDLMPWQQAGNQSLQQLMLGLGLPSDQSPSTQGQSASGVTPGMFTHQFGLQDFQESPAYQFNLQQGQQALDKGANARGNLYAPQTLQDLSKFSQGLASNEWNNAYNQYQNNIGNIWNRFNSMSQGGQAAANQTGVAGANAANSQGMSLQNAGNAQAAGIMGANTALQGGLNNYMFYDYLKNQQRPAYSAQGPYASGYQFPTQ